MKTLFLFLFCFTLIGASAQEQLLHTEMLPYGSVMDLTISRDFSQIDTTINGQGAVWDYSGITPEAGAPILEVMIENPANTPHAASFPTSNYAYVEDPLAYRYFELNDSLMQRVGSVVNGFVKTYSDPQIEYVFPMELGASNDDSWDNNASTFGGNYDLRVVGEGQLILPDATYDRVFMVYVEVEEIFSNDVYFWYNADNGAILMQYVIGDGFFIGTSLRYLSNITIATGIEDPGYLTDLVYPNPMGEQFRLSFSSPEALQIRYSLTNQLGQRISFGELSSAPSFTHSLQFETADLKPGIYYLTLIDQNNPQQFRTLRLVK